MHVIIHLSKPTEWTTPRASPNVNCGLWVIMVCQCRFISCNKWTLWCGVSITGEVISVWGLSVPPSQFCCDPKTALKKIVFFFKKKKKLPRGGENGLIGEEDVLPFSYFCSYTSISTMPLLRSVSYLPDFVRSSKGSSEPVDLSIWWMLTWGELISVK